MVPRQAARAGIGFFNGHTRSHRVLAAAYKEASRDAIQTAWAGMGASPVHPTHKGGNPGQRDSQASAGSFRQGGATHSTQGWQRDHLLGLLLHHAHPHADVLVLSIRLLLPACAAERVAVRRAAEVRALFAAAAASQTQQHSSE